MSLKSSDAKIFSLFAVLFFLIVFFLPDSDKAGKPIELKTNKDTSATDESQEAPDPLSELFPLDSLTKAKGYKHPICLLQDTLNTLLKLHQNDDDFAQVVGPYGHDIYLSSSEIKIGRIFTPAKTHAVIVCFADDSLIVNVYERTGHDFKPICYYTCMNYMLGGNCQFDDFNNDGAKDLLINFYRLASRIRFPKVLFLYNDRDQNLIRLTKFDTLCASEIDIKRNLVFDYIDGSVWSQGRKSYHWDGFAKLKPYKKHEISCISTEPMKYETVLSEYRDGKWVVLNRVVNPTDDVAERLLYEFDSLPHPSVP